MKCLKLKILSVENEKICKSLGTLNTFTFVKQREGKDTSLHEEVSFLGKEVYFFRRKSYFLGFHIKKCRVWKGFNGFFDVLACFCL